jgi:hypothetical protein
VIEAKTASLSALFTGNLVLPLTKGELEGVEKIQASPFHTHEEIQKSD